MGYMEDSPPGGLVDPAAFEPHEPVLHHVHPAHPVTAPDPVKSGKEFHRGKPFTVYCYRHPGLKVDLQILRLIRGPLRGDGHPEHVLRWLRPGVLEDTSLVTYMKEIGIDAIGFLPGYRHRNAVFFGKAEEILPALEFPLPPGSDDLQLRGQRRVGEFETHLVVPLTGGAVGQGVGPHLPGHPHLFPGNKGTGQGGAHEIPALVGGIGLKRGEHELGNEFLPKIPNDDVLGPQGEGPAAYLLPILLLPHIRTEGHHRTTIFFYQPLKNYRGIQPSGIGENNLPGHPTASLFWSRGRSALSLPSLFLLFIAL